MGKAMVHVSPQAVLVKHLNVMLQWLQKWHFTSQTHSRCGQAQPGWLIAPFTAVTHGSNEGLSLAFAGPQ